MTSNLGSDVIASGWRRWTARCRLSAQERSALRTIMNLLKQRLRPEFLNRIDEIVMFRPLGRDQIRRNRRHPARARRAHRDAKNHHLDLEISTEARDWLGERGYDPAFGARPLKRVIQREVTNKLAEEILSGWIQDGETIAIDMAEDGKRAGVRARACGGGGVRENQDGMIGGCEEKPLSIDAGNRASLATPVSRRPRLRSGRCDIGQICRTGLSTIGGSDVKPKEAIEQRPV
jgi:hypothetical protein